MEDLSLPNFNLLIVSYWVWCKSCCLDFKFILGAIEAWANLSLFRFANSILLLVSTSFKWRLLLDIVEFKVSLTWPESTSPLAVWDNASSKRLFSSDFNVSIRSLRLLNYRLCGLIIGLGGLPLPTSSFYSTYLSKSMFLNSLSNVERIFWFNSDRFLLCLLEIWKSDEEHLLPVLIKKSLKRSCYTFCFFSSAFRTGAGKFNYIFSFLSLRYGYRSSVTSLC